MLFLCTNLIDVNHSFRGSYIHLTRFADSHNFKLSYSVIKDRAILYKKGLRIHLRPGTDIILINSKAFQLKRVIRKSNGNILIPRSVNNIIKDYFYQDSNLNNELNKENRFNNSRQNFENNKSKKFIIILDAGHGGKDPGCINKKYGVYEKNIVLSVVKYTYRYLKKYLPGAKIILTRKRDYFLTLESRANIANRYMTRNTKGMFISFHVNYSIFNSGSSGVETFYYAPVSYTRSKEKKILNYRLKNISRIYYNNSLNGNNLKIASRMLDIKLSHQSRALAKTLQRNIISSIPYRTKSRGIKRDRFFVLAHTVMPSVLLELGFLSNRRETRLLVRRKYQKYLARGIAKGIKRYAKVYSID